MTESMIERVARAIWKGVAIRSPDDRVHDRYLRMARAAIGAMREPTEAMECAIHQNPEEARSYWRAMIDAALKETI